MRFLEAGAKTSALNGLLAERFFLEFTFGDRSVSERGMKNRELRMK